MPQPASAIQVTAQPLTFQPLTAATAHARPTGARPGDTAGRCAQASGGLAAARGDGQAGAARRATRSGWTRTLAGVPRSPGQLGGLIGTGSQRSRHTDQPAIAGGFTQTATRAGVG